MFGVWIPNNNIGIGSDRDTSLAWIHTENFCRSCGINFYPSIDTARNQYASWFKSPDAVKQKVSIDPVNYDIHDRNTVIQTIIGSFVNVEKTDPDEEPFVIAYTMIWRRENDGWKLVHMHNSWE